MYQTVRAVYRAGTFVLQEALDVPEESEVELIVQVPLVLAPKITDPTEQARLLKAVNPTDAAKSYPRRSATSDQGRTPCTQLIQMS